MNRDRAPADMTIPEQHEAISRCCDDLSVAMQNEGGLDSIAALRMQLAGLLHANLAREEVELMGPLRRLSANDRPAHFDAMSKEAADLRSRYSEHVGKWNLRAIGANPSGYSADALHLVSTVKQYLGRKQGLLAEWQAAARA